MKKPDGNANEGGQNDLLWSAGRNFCCPHQAFSATQKWNLFSGEEGRSLPTRLPHSLSPSASGGRAYHSIRYQGMKKNLGRLKCHDEGQRMVVWLLNTEITKAYCQCLPYVWVIAEFPTQAVNDTFFFWTSVSHNGAILVVLIGSY